MKNVRKLERYSSHTAPIVQGYALVVVCRTVHTDKKLCEGQIWECILKQGKLIKSVKEMHHSSNRDGAWRASCHVWHRIL